MLRAARPSCSARSAPRRTASVVPRRGFADHKHPSHNAESLSKLSDQQIISQVVEGKLQAHSLEAQLGDLQRAVNIRRQLLEKKLGRGQVLKDLPREGMDYKQVHGVCCENVIGYIQIPVGIVGPLLLDGQLVHVPLATTEGALVASTHRGAKAISESGGVTTSVLSDGMTRAPVVRLPSAKRAVELKEWLSNPKNFYSVASAFNSTSRFASLSEIKVSVAGRFAYLRFKASTGDAMGMNMVSKGCEKALEVLNEYFPDAQLMSLSGNYCIDKKPSSINWIEGRGKSVVAEAIITQDIVQRVLKTTVPALIDLNLAKNLIGSAMAGSVGGFNAHASNIVTALYLATGQDPAQNVESSNCMTLMESANDGRDLRISVTMPSVEVGTVGGGTALNAQGACLDLLNVRGASATRPGANAEMLARVVAATVLAGELSLMSALAAGHLVRSHMKHNRKTENKDKNSKDYGDAGSGALLGPESQELLNTGNNKENGNNKV